VRICIYNLGLTPSAGLDRSRWQPSRRRWLILDKHVHVVVYGLYIPRFPPPPLPPRRPPHPIQLAGREETCSR